MNKENVKKIGKSIKHIKLAFYFRFYLTCFTILAIISYFVIVTINKRAIIINSGFKTKHFAKENTSTISQQADTTTFLKNEEKLIIRSKTTETKNNKINLLFQNHIITPHIRGKIYEGDTEKIEINDGKQEFKIPHEMLLKNGKKNYIHTQTATGNFDGQTQSDLPFKINDDDLFLSGDNFFADEKTNYLLSTKNSHIIQTQMKPKNGKNTTQKYDIKSEKAEVFGEKHIAEFTKKVVFTTDNNIVKSAFARTYFDEKYNITGTFLEKNVKIINKDIDATSNFAYFDTNLNLVVLYDNVKIVNKSTQLNNEIYIYNTENKTSMSFNENAKISKTEAEAIYTILNELSQELTEKHKRKIHNVIKMHKRNKNKSSKESDNSNINRNKRAKINLYEK